MMYENFQLYDYFSPVTEDSIKRTFVVSLVLHTFFFSLAILSGPILSRFLPSKYVLFGGAGGIGDSINVRAIQELPGLKLPAPEQPTESKVASENEGLYQPPKETVKDLKKPKPEPVDDTKALALEELKNLERRRREVQRRQNLQEPENAVPYGRGGQPSFAYGEFRAGGRAGGGVGFEGGFGERYAWYARAIVQKISSNFQEQMLGAQLREAPRVFVAFTIEKDGSVSSIVLRSSSGIPSFDGMAVRSIQASSPMPPLPGDFSGNRVNVECFFDFRR
ncbi:MAG: TonB family protein [Terriglobia bacterium]